jgi:hypothetical protein
MAYLDKIARKLKILTKINTNLEGNLWFRFKKNRTELKLTTNNMEW